MTEQRVERSPLSTKHEARSCKTRFGSSCSKGGHSPVRKVINFNLKLFRFRTLLNYEGFTDIIT